MKKFITACVLAAFAGSAHAQDDEAWKAEAKAEVLTLDHVVEAMWAQSGALWLSTYNTDPNIIEPYTEHVICSWLVFSGKPQGTGVIVTWFDARAMAGGKLKEIHRGWCK